MANGLVLFRVDASHFLGNGHVVRCVALAEALLDEGYACVFACRDLPGNAITWLQQRFFEVEILSAPETVVPANRDDFTAWGKSKPLWDAHESAKTLNRDDATCIASSAEETVSKNIKLLVDHYSDTK